MDQHQVPANHPEFAKLRRFAARMAKEAAALADGSSEPGGERIQAFNYSATALLNEADFQSHEEAALALGALLGSTACAVSDEDIDAFIRTALDQAFLTLSAARGEAPRRLDA